jgi:hypothetical protein
MEKPVLIIAFDIEARGKSASKHGIVAVGIVAGLSNGAISFEKEWRVSPMQGQSYEPRCLFEFWNKNPELKKRLEEDTVSPMSFATAFRSMIDTYEANFEIYLLSDNPTFDAGFINFYLDAYGLDSMQYGQNGTAYRMIHDSDEYARGVLRMKPTSQWVDNTALCNTLCIVRPEFQGERHSPVNDARDIYKTHVAVINATPAK